MSQPIGIISLKCPNCGAAVSITPELDVFACGYCGAQQMVQRGSGTVSLKLIGEAIARVQHGTDRTAAELAIRRLRDDLAGITTERQKIDSVITSGNITIGTIGIVVIVAFSIGGVLLNSSQFMPALVLICFGVFMATRVAKNVKTCRLLEYYLTKNLSVKETNIKRQLEQHLETVGK